VDSCSWCGAQVEESDGFRAYEPESDRRAVFCRLEHVVPWEIEGPNWGVGPLTEPAANDESQRSCAHCGEKLGETHVLLIRHRGEHRVGDGFCSSEHMAQWAKAGGRWQ
jgi:hypothetical protein